VTDISNVCVLSVWNDWKYWVLFSDIQYYCVNNSIVCINVFSIVLSDNVCVTSIVSIGWMTIIRNIFISNAMAIINDQ